MPTHVRSSAAPPSAGAPPATRRGAGRRAWRGRAARALALALAAALGAACGPSVETRLEDVRALQEAGRFEQSIEPLRSVLGEEPDHARANYLLGVALLQTGRPTLAVHPLRRAAGGDEPAEPAGRLLVSTLLAAERFAEAEAASTQILRRDPESLFALQARANARLALERPRAALADAEKMLEQVPGSLPGHTLAAVAQVRLGRPDAAEQTMDALAARAREAGAEQLALAACATRMAFYREFLPERAGPVALGCVDRFPAEPVVLREAEATLDAAGRPRRATELWRRAAAARPDDRDLQSLLADRLARAGRGDEAEARLRAAAERWDDARAWEELSRLLERLGRGEEALAAIERALAGREDEDGAAEGLRRRRAHLLVALGRHDEALAAAADLDGAAARAWVEARVLHARGRPEEALERLQRAFEEQPLHAGARLLAGRTAEELGRPDEALGHYEDALRTEAGRAEASLAAARLHLARGDDADALRMAALHLRLRPEEPAAHLVASRAAAGLGELDAARSHLDALAALPGQTPLAVAERAGLAWREGGPAAAARAIEESGLDLADPASRPALHALVESALAAGDAGRALPAVERALARSPASAALRAMEGHLRLAAGEEDAARAAFEAALDSDPDHPDAILGAAAFAAGDEPERALALLERLEGQGEPAARAGHLAAQILLQRGRREAARERLEAAVAAHPRFAAARNDLAWMLAEDGEDLDRALELAREAAALDPRPTVLDTLGTVWLRRDRPEQAARAFERALERDPEMPSVRYRLGVAYARLGRRAAAREAFRTALEAGTLPEDEAAAAREELAQLRDGEAAG